MKLNKHHYLCLIVCMLFIAKGLIAAGDSDEEKLRQRVTEFYKALQANQSAKAGTFVRDTAKAGFRPAPGRRIIAFRITGIKHEPERSSAVVEITLKMPAMFVAIPMEIPFLARWKKENGEWFFDPDDPPQTMGEKFQECYYQRHKKHVPSQVKLERKFIDFGVAARGKTLNLRFPFINQSSQEIKIEKVYVQSPFMKDVSAQAAIKPGQKSEIVIDLDTSPLHLNYDTSIFVEFQPINECARVRIKGRIFTAKELSAYTPK